MDVKFEWKDTHHDAFMKLKEAIIQTPILRYPDMTKPYIVYTDVSDDACRAQLSQTHDGAEFLVVSCRINLQTPRGDGVHPNKKLMVSTSPSRNGTTTYKEWTS